MMTESLVANETRIRDLDGFCGTVVYIGPVASAKNPEEIYAGIKWDDKSRGKHDGSVICRRTNELVRHFSCGPTQGSFLRLNKMDRGVALTASLLKTKYVDMNAPVIAPNNVLPHTARTSSGRPKPIEFLGEMKIRERQQLADIDTISLRREGISRASDDKMPEDFRKIKDIDLAGNLLSSWTEILKIMRQFPRLEIFNVAYNRVRDIGLPVEQFDRMKVLNLNNCSLGTKTLQWIGDSMPCLEKLCIANSNLSDLQSIHVCGLGHLESLDCSNCQLDSWENQVDHFSALPCLEQLSLDDNPLSTLPSTPKSEVYFPCLNSLQLAGTQFKTWMDLEGINALFASIKSLRLRHTPLTSPMGQGETRFLAVARFPSLDYFNASVISMSEQQEAERRYVSLVSNMLLKLEEKDDQEKLLAEHPRYPKLSEEYKNLVVTSSGGANGAGTNIAASVCNVTIRSMSPSSCDIEPILRRLPDSLSVGRLKALCARTFGLGVDLMTLHFRTAGDAFPVELDNDFNALKYYGVCDGAEILMNEIDVDARQRESQRLVKEQERLISEQEHEVSVMQELQRKKCIVVKMSPVLPHTPDQSLLESFRYINSMPGKNVRGKMIDCFQLWLEVESPDDLNSIKEIVGDLHNASLMIDDIEDNSKLRRGVPVAHSIFGIPNVINSANYAYFLALEKCHALNNAKAMNVFVGELLNLHRGQGQDIMWRDDVRCPTEAQYIEMVKDKTGGLFRLAVGLMHALATKNTNKDFISLVNNLALYFQIRDDYINLADAEYMKSKSFCEDLTEGKFSFPIIHSIRSNPDDTRVLSILKKRTDDVDVKRYAQQLLLENGSLDYTRQKCRDLKNEIAAEISSLGGNKSLLLLMEKLDIQLQGMHSAVEVKESAVDEA